MAQKTVVILVVGLTRELIGEHSPHLLDMCAGGRVQELVPPLPAVTTTVQSTMLTGRPPGGHGIVGNGWYNREMAEVQFWKQSNRLVQGEKVWETARRRDPSVTCAKMFWWYNMYSSADVSVTPRPQYRADGRKVPDCYSHPAELRDRLQAELGQFPLFRFWGPAASIESTRWIAESAKIVDREFDPTLSLVYLPHLDYPLQKVGPEHASIPGEVSAVDEVVGGLVEHFRGRRARVIVLSEYGIDPVDEAVHVNRVLREHGLVAVREENGRELLDAGASRAFAVADHQVAHVYVRDDEDRERVRAICAETPGVERVLDGELLAAAGLDHERSGDLVLVAERRRWFSYYYWLDDARAPDFARTVDIHRKPGYDPVELFIDPKIVMPKAAIGWRLAKKKLGFRRLMDVIPLDTSLVRGSHGRVEGASRPIMITDAQTSFRGDEAESLPSAAARDAILDHLGVGSGG